MFTYEIKEQDEYHYNTPRIFIETELHSLPMALRRLAEQGYDLEPSLKALQQAVEDQRKRKALDAAINDLAKPAEKAEK